MKFPVYDYRQMDGGRPAMSLLDVPPDHEDVIDVWKRNEWVIAIVDDKTDHRVYVAAVDFLSDVVLYKIPIEATEPADLARILAVDPPLISAAAKQAIEEGREPHFPSESEES